MSDLTTAACCPVPETWRPSSSPLALPLGHPPFVFTPACPFTLDMALGIVPLSPVHLRRAEGGGAAENRLERNRKRGTDECTNVYVACVNEGHGLSDDG